MRCWVIPIIVVITFLIPDSVIGNTYSDPIYGFSIKAPESWKIKGYKDGTDRVVDVMSRDGNVMVRTRVLKLPSTVSLDALQKIYEKKYVSGQQPYQSDYRELNGLDGLVFYYHWNYKGNPIEVRTFIGEKKSIAYIISQIIPKKMLAARANETEKVMASFSIKSVILKTDKKIAESLVKNVIQQENRMDESTEQSIKAEDTEIDLQKLSQEDIEEVMSDYFLSGGDS